MPMPQNDAPSNTAMAVLLGVWLTACDPKTRGLVSPEVRDYTDRALAALGSPYRFLLKLGIVRWVARRKEAGLLAGVCSHYAVRKQEIHGLVEHVAPQRLVVVGAGFDGLAYRFADRMETIEYDHPATQERKRQILAALPHRPVGLRPADLSDESFRFHLSRNGRTLFVLEGVTMYLQEARIRNLLHKIAGIGELIFTFMTLDERGRPTFGATQNQIDRYLARVGEPFLWGISPENLEGFLDREGWQLRQVIGAPNPRMPFLRPAEAMIAGEWIAYATPKSDLR